MGKTYLSTVKYLIKTEFTIDGIVDKHDIIGAIFGQSEGLMGEDLDLKELQKNGKLGRIEVETRAHSGKTSGLITIPSGMDKVKTSILAAAMESVDKVGPCASEFKTIAIEDTRGDKRKAVTERAKELLQRMSETMPESTELAEEIVGGMRGAKMKEYGKEKLPAGPDVDKEKELIVVEGRADVLNLLKHGIKNCIAIGGANIPNEIIDLGKKKELTIFVDGDRGGDLITRQLGQAVKVTSFTKAPTGKEVEELTLKEILAALRKKRPIDQLRTSFRDRFPEKREYSRERPGGESKPRGFRSSERSDDRPSGRSSFRTGNRSGPGPGSRSSFGSGGRSFRQGGRGDFRSGGRGSFRPGGRSGKGFRPEERGGRFREDRGRRRSPRRFPRESEDERPMPQKPNDLGEFSKPMEELNNSLKARFLDKKGKKVKEISVRNLLEEMKKQKEPYAVVFDGIVTKRLLEQAEKSGVQNLVGMKKGKIEETGKVKVNTLY